MHTIAVKRQTLLITTSTLRLAVAGFYQNRRLLKALVHAGEVAYDQRDIDVLEHIARELRRGGLGEPVADLFLGLALLRRGEPEIAQGALVRASIDPNLSARSAIALAAVNFQKGQTTEARRLYREAMDHADERGDLWGVVIARHGLACVASADGLNVRAYKDLEDLLPLANALCLERPGAWTGVLNSLAVEAQAAGDKERARRIGRIVMQSPLANRHPEWADTARLIGIIRERPSNLVFLSGRDRHESERMPFGETAKILQFQPHRPVPHLRLRQSLLDIIWDDRTPLRLLERMFALCQAEAMEP